MVEPLLASLLAGLATGLGAIPLLFFRRIPRRIYDSLLGFAAGVMLSASSLSLIVPALDRGGLGETVVGVAAGALLVLLLERVIPHLEPHFSLQPLSLTMRQGLLLGMAITIHNFPEGFAVGVGYSSPYPSLGLVLALAIAAQNVPEGLAVAAPLRQEGVSRLKCLFWATASGLTEPLAAVLGVLFLTSISTVLPLGLAFAGGAMLYVVCDQLIPECHSHGNEREASLGIIVGFVVMIALQNIFSR